MKKFLIAVLVLIVALAACYYAFPEKVAGYMMDAARCKAGVTKKEIKIDDHNIVYLEGGKGPTILFITWLYRKQRQLDNASPLFN